MLKVVRALPGLEPAREMRIARILIHPGKTEPRSLPLKAFGVLPIFGISSRSESGGNATALPQRLGLCCSPSLMFTDWVQFGL